MVDAYEEREFETYLAKSELISFLKNIVEQLEKENRVNISSDEMVIDFEFTEPIEVKVEHSEKKLKIKIEFKKRAKLNV